MVAAQVEIAVSQPCGKWGQRFDEIQDRVNRATDQRTRPRVIETNNPFIAGTLGGTQPLSRCSQFLSQFAGAPLPGERLTIRGVIEWLFDAFWLHVRGRLYARRCEVPRPGPTGNAVVRDTGYPIDAVLRQTYHDNRCPYGCNFFFLGDFAVAGRDRRQRSARREARVRGRFRRDSVPAYRGQGPRR